jgi:hypothetical protein
MAARASWNCRKRALNIYACNEPIVLHCLSSVYSVTIHLPVTGLLVAHHQEVTTYIRDNWCVFYVLVDCRQACREYTRINCHTYTLLPPDNGLLKPETCRVVLTQ